MNLTAQETRSLEAVPLAMKIDGFVDTLNSKVGCCICCSGRNKDSPAAVMGIQQYQASYKTMNTTATLLSSMPCCRQQPLASTLWLADQEQTLILPEAIPYSRQHITGFSTRTAL